MKSTFLVVVAALAACPLWAQELSVHPESPAPGEPFFVRAEGTFPTPCSLNGDRFDTLQGGGRVELTLRLQPGACITVVTDLERSFGAFRLDPGLVTPGESVELVFRTDQPPSGVEIGRIDLIVGEPGERASATPQSGVYWDPFFANNGVAIEAHGDRLFLAAYTYDGDGADTWRVAQGELTAGRFEGDLLRFSDGTCLLCGDAGSQGRANGEAVPVQVVFAGGQAAFLGTGDEPGRAMELRPFAQRLVESEPTIAAETFFMADLGGRWLFTDTADGTLHRVTDLTPAFSGYADGGIAFFAAANRSVTIECGGSPGPERFICRLFVDEQYIGAARGSDVSHNFIRGDTFLGVRLE